MSPPYLPGSPHQFTKATVEQVEQFLTIFQQKVAAHKWYLRWERTENEYTLYDLDLDDRDIEACLLALQADNYYSGPIPNNNPKSHAAGPLWEFGTMVRDTEVYIKVRLGAANADAICVSFHYPQHKIIYHLRRP